MENIQSKHVVFVTGAFVTNRGWEPWQNYFESKGYKTLAPPHPHKDGDPAELRRQHPHSPIAQNRLAAVIDHYADVIRSLPEKPILIGHSLGGCITQVLVNRDLAAAGVAIHSIPPLGVFPYEFSFLKAGWRALGYLTSTKEDYLMSFETWQYAFTNGMPLEEQRKAYEANAIPESKLVARDGLTDAAKVDYDKPHVPLLLIGGSADTIAPAHLNRRNFAKYKKNGSVIEYKEFPGKNHFVLGLPTWHEEADYVLNWLNTH
ncbi:MAG TPA: alpha/beta hydrolase [bacterium]|nr:alpha/beta hydrolase [bacterium]